MSADRSDVFVPRTCVVGKFERTFENGKTFAGAKPVRGGIVSCRFENDKWVKCGAFERLTGYKPGYSRDAEKQLKKTIFDAVSEFENVPVEGFRIAGWNENIYKLTANYRIGGDVVIEDPRGFAFGMSVDAFFGMISENGCTLSGGRLDGPFAYGWTSSAKTGPELTLVAAGKQYESAKRLSEAFYEKKKENTITDSLLKYGHVYRSKKLGGDFVYLGIRDTFSADCHRQAFMLGSYDTAAFVEHDKFYARMRMTRQFPTSTGKHVFYSLRTSSKQMPYFVRTSSNGMFDEEVGWPDDVPPMYNDEDTPATLANIENDMSVSPCFNKIRLAPAPETFERMPYGVFERIFGCLKMRNMASSGKEVVVFPFDFLIYYVKSVRAEDGRWLKLAPYNIYKNSDLLSWDVVDLSVQPAVSFGLPTRYGVKCHAQTTCGQIYDMYKPMSYVMFYENGKRVPPCFTAFMLPANIVKMQ